MYLNKVYSKLHVGKHMSLTFPIQKGLTPEDASLLLTSQLFNKWSNSVMLQKQKIHHYPVPVHILVTMFINMPAMSRSL